MIGHFAFLLVAGMLFGFAGQATAQSAVGGFQPPAEAAPTLRFFFLSDMHSRHAHLQRFLAEVERERPELILKGGDFLHDATEAEFRRAIAERTGLGVPWHMVRGNHDAELRGPFAGPPSAFPEFRAFTHRDVRFILLDNHEEVLNETQFQRLEAELRAHAGERIVVVMHVPPLVSRKPAAVRLRHLVPFELACPVMRDPEQVERFTGLMERYGVLAVLAGHTHFPDDVERGGVHYVVAGAAGGLTPGLGIANEYLDIRLRGRELEVRRVVLRDPPRDPLRFVARAFRFYAELNHFNHAEQVWNYVPSASVQFRTALKRTETGDDEGPAVWGAAAFERQLGERGRHALFTDVGLSAGSRELATHLAAGYKLRPVGDFNRNLYVGVAAAGNAGMLARTATAGVGAQLGVGLEWRSLTAEASRTWATNHRATSVTFGRRF
jgi:predicted phosphodiesterase